MSLETRNNIDHKFIQHLCLGTTAANLQQMLDCLQQMLVCLQQMLVRLQQMLDRLQPTLLLFMRR